MRIDNPPESGSVALVLFNSANTFGDLRDPFRVDIHPLDGRDEYIIEDVEAGEYALMVYYDENGNGRMDKNFIGIPKEPLGFSNRYRPKAPPAYERAAFTLGQGESRSFDVELYLPLGKFGRIGVGAGIIFRSSPYRDYNGAVTQILVVRLPQSIQTFSSVHSRLQHLPARRKHLQTNILIHTFSIRSAK